MLLHVKTVHSLAICIRQSCSRPAGKSADNAAFMLQQVWGKHPLMAHKPGWILSDNSLIQVRLSTCTAPYTKDMPSRGNNGSTSACRESPTWSPQWPRSWEIGSAWLEISLVWIFCLVANLIGGDHLICGRCLPRQHHLEGKSFYLNAKAGEVPGG